MQVWFQDEARFGQQGTLTRQWALKGTRPRAWRQTQYDYLYVFGAACPQTGQTVGLLANIVYLLEHGHKAIAFIGSSFLPDFYLQSFAGFKNYLKQKNRGKNAVLFP